MIDPSSISIAALPSVALADKKELPTTPCIYFAIDGQGSIQYIGRSVNPQQRWNSHHRYDDIAKMGGARISYMSVDKAIINGVEAALIAWFQPPLNNATQPTSSKLGRFFESRRNSLGLTQDDMSKVLHVTPATYCNWEKGRAHPSVRLGDIPQMAKAFGVSINTLVYAAVDAEEESNNV